MDLHRIEGMDLHVIKYDKVSKRIEGMDLHVIKYEKLLKRIEGMEYA